MNINEDNEYFKDLVEWDFTYEKSVALDKIEEIEQDQIMFSPKKAEIEMAQL